MQNTKTLHDKLIWHIQQLYNCYDIFNKISDIKDKKQQIISIKETFEQINVFAFAPWNFSDDTNTYIQKYITNNLSNSNLKQNLLGFHNITLTKTSDLIKIFYYNPKLEYVSLLLNSDALSFLINYLAINQNLIEINIYTVNLTAKDINKIILQAKRYGFEAGDTAIIGYLKLYKPHNIINGLNIEIEQYTFQKFNEYRASLKQIDRERLNAYNLRCFFKNDDLNNLYSIADEKLENDGYIKIY